MSEYFQWLINDKSIQSFAGSILSAEEENKAEEFLCSYNEEYINGLCLFKLKDQCIFPPYMFKESFLQTITPNRWWHLIEQKQSKICDKTKKNYQMASINL